MNVKPIAYSYWRRIKDRARMFSDTPESVKLDVMYLARSDVKSKVITEEDYEELIGQPYEE